MTHSPSFARAAEALALDHRRVDELVVRLRTATDLTSLVSALEELGTVLVAHFAHEESPGGIYEVMGVASPELRTPLGDLLGEHYGLLTDIRALAGRGREILERSHVDLYAEARQLAERLQVHEAKEDAMAGAIAPGFAATWSVTR
jgi:hypothetical protein